MEIIFYRYGSICEPDLMDAFTACGIKIIEEETEISQKSISSEDRIKLLGELILTNHPTFVFSINYFPHISEICEKLHILYVALSVDCPVLELFHISIHNKCNRIFLFDYMQYERFHPQNPECIFYLPLAANTNRWDTVISSFTDNVRWQYSCNVSFVGSLYTEKSPLRLLELDDFVKGYLDGLTEAQLRLSGYNIFEDALSSAAVKALRTTDSSFYEIKNSIEDTDAYVAANYYLSMQASALDRIRTLSELGKSFDINLYTRSDTSLFAHNNKIHCLGGVTTHAEMPAVFHYSKINLNITMKSIQSGLSQRIWDILGCQGFLLTNYQSELPEYFEIGKDLECYENLTELKEKISYYLTHEEERYHISQNGYLKVKERHSYIHRVFQILKTLFPDIASD